MILELEIKNWNKYNPRSDVKSCSWFRMSNDFFSDPDFYGCSIESRVLWLFLLSIASKKMSSVVRINTEMVLDNLKISKKNLENAITELKETGSISIISSNVKSARSNPIVLEMLPSATNERTDEQTDTDAGASLPAKEILVVNEPGLDFSETPWLEPVKPENKPRIRSGDIIQMFNQICNRSFKNNPTHALHINARINEKYQLEDFERVITFKFKEWRSSPKMRKYLRPETIFGTKFDGYLQEAKNADKPILDPLEQLAYEYLGDSIFIARNNLEEGA